MRAVILAAGVGRRLRPFTDRHPKSLLRFGDRTLLERHLTGLAGVVDHTTLVVGHLVGQVTAEVERVAPAMPVELVENTRFEEGSGLSLLAGLAQVSGPCLVMDADLLLAPALYRSLAEAPSDNCLLADPTLVDTGEEVKAIVDEGGIVRGLGKKIDRDGRVFGESVGMFRFSGPVVSRLKEALERATEENPAVEYEPVVDSLLGGVDLTLVSTDGQPWLEIDFPDDVVRASREVFPRLGELGTEPLRLPLGSRLEVVQRVAQPGGLGPGPTDVVYRALSFLPSLLLSRLGLSANAITVGWIAVGLVGVLLLGSGWPVLGALLLQAGYVLDFVDGEVARLRGETSTRGYLLDLVGHSLVKGSAFLAAGYGSFAAGAPPSVLVASIVATVSLETGSLLPLYAGEAGVTKGESVFRSLPPGGIRKQVLGVVNIVFESPGIFGLLLLGAATGALPAILTFYAIATPLWLAYRLLRYLRA